MPKADNAVLLSSTNTERQRIQRVGRVLRRAEGKLKASIYYLYIKNSVDRAVLMNSFPSGCRFLDLDFEGGGFGSRELEKAIDLVRYAGRDKEKALAAIAPYFEKAMVSPYIFLPDSELKKLKENPKADQNYLMTVRLLRRALAKLYPEDWGAEQNRF